MPFDRFTLTKHLGVWVFILALVLIAWALLYYLTPVSYNAYMDSITGKTIKVNTDDKGLYTAARQKAVEGAPMPWMSSGDVDPIVSVVQFTDFTCVHCQASWPAIRQLLQYYPRKVKLILRDRTPSFNSLNLALAAHCSGEQGKYAAIYDKFFQNQSETLGSTSDSIMNIADQIGLNKTTFTTCLTNRKYLDSVKRDMTDADALGVIGTPTWFINGVKFEGEMTVKSLSDIIDPLLK